jgi:hypothetical protein
MPDTDDTAARAKKLPEGHVAVRILKLGHEKIFTGKTLPFATVKFPTFKRDEVTSMPRDAAAAYEDRGMVEILP